MPDDKSSYSDRTGLQSAAPTHCHNYGNGRGQGDGLLECSVELVDYHT